MVAGSVRDRLLEVFVSLVLGVRLSHAEVGNGAIGYRSDMWTHSNCRQREFAIIQVKRARALTLDTHMSVLLSFPAVPHFAADGEWTAMMRATARRYEWSRFHNKEQRGVGVDATSSFVPKAATAIKATVSLSSRIPEHRMQHLTTMIIGGKEKHLF